MELKKRLSAIQQSIKVPKSHTNTFAKYKYRNAEDILSAVKPLLGDCCLVISDELKELNGVAYIEATVSLQLGDEIIQTKAQAIIDDTKRGMSAEQKTGSASSYCRKYALNGLLLLDDNTDVDSLKPPTPSENDIKTIKKEVSDKINIDNLLEDL